jgi:hypothetical protein
VLDGGRCETGGYAVVSENHALPIGHSAKTPIPFGPKPARYRSTTRSASPRSRATSSPEPGCRALLALVALIGTVISVFDAAPYIRDTIRGSTRPHRGTWLIWMSLSWVVLASNRADGAVWSMLPLAAQALQNCAIFFLSIRRGEGGVDRLDRLMLAVAALGVAGWFVFTDPTLATLAVILADVMGALMMLPKAWRDPSSETISTFVLSSVVGICAFAAVGSFAFSLVIYPAYYIAVNGIIAGVLIYRRPVVGALDVGAAGDKAA